MSSCWTKPTAPVYNSCQNRQLLSISSTLNLTRSLTVHLNVVNDLIATVVIMLYRSTTVLAYTTLLLKHYVINAVGVVYKQPAEGQPNVHNGWFTQSADVPGSRLGLQLTWVRRAVLVCATDTDESRQEVWGLVSLRSHQPPRPRVQRNCRCNELTRSLFVRQTGFCIFLYIPIFTVATYSLYRKYIYMYVAQWSHLLQHSASWLFTFSVGTPQSIHRPMALAWLFNYRQSGKIVVVRMCNFLHDSRCNVV